MPPHDRVRLHKDHRRAPVPPDASQGDPKQSVARLEVWAFGRAFQRRQLLPQRQVLQDQFAMAAERQRQRAANHDEKLQHASIVAASARTSTGRVLAKVRWKFLGPDTMKVPDVPTAFNYCATDGRPHTVNTLKNRKRVTLAVADVFPAPTRPMCWVVQTQADVFQGIMSGAINPPIADQVALLRKYYQCDAIKGKVSAALFKALCEFAAP